ncbi:MAG: hypothetical protein U1E77_02600 [Inhella sp.]
MKRALRRNLAALLLGLVVGLVLFAAWVAWMNRSPAPARPKPSPAPRR